jgi:hypothetical protein
MEPRFTVDAGDTGEPIPFDIAGVDRHRQPWRERFTALPGMPLATALDLGDNLDVVALVALLRRQLVPEDRERFDGLLADEDRIIRAEALWDVLSGLTDALLGRPTSPSPGSPNGAGDTGPTSRDGSSSPDSPPIASTAEPSST